MLPKEDKMKLSQERWELINKVKKIKSQKAKDLCKYYVNFFIFTDQKNKFKPFELSKSAFMQLAENKPLKMLMGSDENPSSNVSESTQQLNQEKSSSSTYVVSEESLDFPNLGFSISAS
jgi:hypothetical protein